MSLQYDLNTLSLKVYRNKKEANCPKFKASFLIKIQMQIYRINTYYGKYQRSTTPNTFTSSKGVNLIFKTRTAPKPGQPKHYLMAQEPGSKPFYFSALWSTSPDTYTISDTQKKRATCKLLESEIQIVQQCK